MGNARQVQYFCTQWALKIDFDNEPVLNKLKQRITVYQEAGNTLANLLHQYPASVELKYEAAGIFTVFEAVCLDATREEKKNWKMQKKELLYAVYKSGVTEYWQPAATALAAMAVLENDLEEAERLLGELPELTSDPTIIRMELYLRRGERRRAVELIQNRLLQLARQIQTCMTCLLDEKLEPDAERALEIGELSRQFESLFFNRTQLSDAKKLIYTAVSESRRK